MGMFRVRKVLNILFVLCLSIFLFIACGKQDNLKKKKIAAGVTEGISAGLGGTMGGIGKMVTADMMMREKGSQIKGKCVLGNGRIITEDNQIKLTW